jgi:hypothetical protein
VAGEAAKWTGKPERVSEREASESIDFDFGFLIFDLTSPSRDEI